MGAAHEPIDSARLTAVLGVTAVLFFVSLLPFELLPEIPVDIDAKPFFVPLALCALLPAGRVGLSIGLGVALGEGIRDLMEGYELDDPIGFLGYVLGFWAASAIFSISPRNKFVLIAGSIVCAAIQGAIEASSFLIFGEEGLPVALWSAFGNTISHGIVWGAVPLLIFLPRLRGHIAVPLGFEPRGRKPDPLPASVGRAQRGPNIVASANDVAFAWPGGDVAIAGVGETVRRGEIVRLTGGGAETLALVLAGLAPRATGGRLSADVEPARRPSVLGRSPSDQLSQVRALEQVASILLADGGKAAPALAQAEDILAWAGLPAAKMRSFVWELTASEMAALALASAKARKPDLLIVEDGYGPMTERTAAALMELFGEILAAGAVVLIGDAVPEVEARRRQEIAGSSRARFLVAESQEAAGEPVRIPTLHSRHQGFWRARDPRVKWLLLLTLMIMIYMAPDWRWMAASAIAGLLVTLMARPPLGWLLIAVGVQLPNVLGLVLIPYLGAGASPEELAFGLRLGLGWLAAILFGIALLSTMDIAEMVAGIRGIGLPRRFGFAVGYAFTLTYLALADFARRPALPRLRLRHPVKTAQQLASLVLPIFNTVIARGGAIAVTLAATGSDRGVPPFALGRFSAADRFLLLVGLTALAAAAAARFGFVLT